MKTPATYSEAQDWLKRRVTVPTVLSSRELALEPTFPAEVRMRSFFSAKVASATILE